MQPESYNYKRIWQISYPLILGGIGQTVINVSDTIFLGRVSEQALGAVAIAGLYYVTFFMLGMGFSVGSQILIARFDGEKNKSKITEVFNTSSIVLLFIGIATFLCLHTFSGSILSRLVKSKAILDGVLEFLRYRSFGIIPGFAILLFRSFYSGLGKTAIVGYTTVISAVFNLIFNYLLVFGNGGFPEMSIAGSGLASTLGELVAAVFAIIYTIRTGYFKEYQLLSKVSLVKDSFAQILKVSTPLMIQFFIALWSWFVFFLIIEKIGERELAISNLIRNVYMLLMLCLMGFSNATNTIVSNLLGQNRRNEIIPVLKKIILWSLFSTTVVVIVNLVFWRFTFSIFTNDISLINDSFKCLAVISGSSLLFAVSYIMLSAVSGSGRTLITLIIEATTLTFYLSATYLSAIKYKLSLEIVWCTEYVYFLALGIISFFYLKYKILPTN